MENNRPVAGMLLSRSEVQLLLMELSAGLEVEDRTEDNEPSDPELARLVCRFNQFLGRSDGSDLLGAFEKGIDGMAKVEEPVRCEHCGLITLEAKSCTYTHFRMRNGTLHYRGTGPYDVNKRCHSCGIVNVPGNCHHFGCSIERCPLCGEQAITCGCLKKKGASLARMKFDLSGDLSGKKVKK